MEFLKRSIKRSKSGRQHPPPPSGSWFRKRSATADKPKRGKLTNLTKRNEPETRNSTEVVQVQMHQAGKTPSLQNATSASGYEHNKKGRRARSKSLTHSENDALGTLDEVIMNFDDNLNEIGKDGLNKKVPSSEKLNDNHYESPHKVIHEVEDRLSDPAVPVNPPKLHHGAVIMHDPIYSKPVKNSNPTSTRKAANENEPPAVPHKRFDVNEHQIKFSDLKKTPSTYLTQSLDRTDWASAKIQKFSHVRKVKDDNNNSNDNYSLKRGELSQSLPIITDNNYKEPPRDYEITDGITSSEPVSAPVIKDNWSNGSVSSSSLSGSTKAHKPIRPEVLRMLRDKKTQQEQQSTDDPRLDRLVKRSFRLIQESSLKDVLNQPSQDEYGLIRNETDKWVASSERLRASSQGSRPSTAPSTKDSPKKETITKIKDEPKYNNVLTSTESGVETEKVIEESVSKITTSKDEIINDSLSNMTESLIKVNDNEPSGAAQQETDLSKTTRQPNGIVVPEAPVPPPIHPAPEVPENNDTSKEDQELIQLMETGNPGENASDSAHNNIEFANTPWVPRAVRMSFGSSWEGIRKDRRAWKSREMHFAASQSARNNSKKLSNRYDEQNDKMEMLF